MVSIAGKSAEGVMQAYEELMERYEDHYECFEDMGEFLPRSVWGYSWIQYRGH